MRAVIGELLFDDDVALAMATRAGAHGVYVHNAMAEHEGDGFVLTADGSVALVWIGPRGNLVVIEGGTAVPVAMGAKVADEIVRRRKPWRIAMGPPATIDCLRERLPVAPLAFREQVYYVGDARSAVPSPRAGEVRSAQRADRDRLMQATLALNASDLNVDPARVDRRWLRDTIDERIANGTTRVIGAAGAFASKLDIGSDGPGGAVIEGVFTFPEHRGQGLATALVATCLSRASGAMCLHVAKHNRPARAAYAAAGMREDGSCRLLLLP